MIVALHLGGALVDPGGAHLAVQLLEQVAPLRGRGRRGAGRRRRPPAGRSRWRAASPWTSACRCRATGRRLVEGPGRVVHHLRAACTASGHVGELVPDRLQVAAAGRRRPAARRPMADRRLERGLADARPRRRRRSGRNRSRVGIATAKPRSGSPSRWSAGTNTPSNVERPIGVRRQQLERLRPRARPASPGTAKALTPAAPAPSVVRANTV